MAAGLDQRAAAVEAALLKTHQALVSGVAGFVQQAACTALTLPAESWRQ